MRPTLLAAALWLILAADAGAAAQTEADSAADAPADVQSASGGGAPAHELERITVTATRTERAIEDVPSTVSVIDRERMDRELVRDLKDLVRYEPGVSVRSSAGRFGIGDIRIRGLDGNRVLIEVDGIPVSDAFAIGSFSDANRNFVDLDTLKRVEIVRGPASSLYGSDALGGVVSFVTKDPSDYLTEDKHAYFGLKLGYESENQGLFAGATSAFGGERWSGLVAVSHRQGREPDNQGEVETRDGSRTAPNPQDSDGRSLLTRLVFAPDADQRFRLTVEGNEDEVDTDVLSARGFQPLTGATTLSLLGDDRQTRARVSFAHEMDALDAGFADSLHWQIYRQDSETTQRTDEERLTAAGSPRRREREFNFDQRVYGAEATLYKGFATGAVEHALTYGFDIARSELRQKRDGREIFLDTGAVTSAILPDVFPVRDFPVSETTAAALFVQDEMSFADGRFRLVPGVRVDRYELEPEVDTIFTEDNPGIVPVGITETHVSPKLGAVWHFSDDWSLFASYAAGFRSPPYNDANLGFTNLQFGYTAIPNPDLKPETSDGFELGLRYSGAAAYFSLSGYLNRYDDFIESLRVISMPPQTPLIVFQSQNVAEAEIRGVELAAGLELGALADALQGWSLRGAASWQRGDDKTADMPLTSVDPARATLGLAYDRDTWGVELVGSFAQRKKRLPALASGDPMQPPQALFAPPGYGVVDLLAHWQLAPEVRLNVGVFNLTDKKYWDWADLPLPAAGSTILDRYTRPGRSLSASIAFEW